MFRVRPPSPRYRTLWLKYHVEIESKFENSLACLSGAWTSSNQQQKRGKNLVIHSLLLLTAIVFHKLLVRAWAALKFQLRPNTADHVARIIKTLALLMLVVFTVPIKDGCQEWGLQPAPKLVDDEGQYEQRPGVGEIVQHAETLCNYIIPSPILGTATEFRSGSVGIKRKLESRSVKK